MSSSLVVSKYFPIGQIKLSAHDLNLGNMGMSIFVKTFVKIHNRIDSNRNMANKIVTMSGKNGRFASPMAFIRNEKNDA
jgi:hypothetical protein